MQQHDSPLQQTGIHILLFLFGLMVISWPLVAQSSPWTLSELFRFLFICWFGFVIVLFFVSRAGHKEKDTGPTSAKNDSAEEPR